MSGLETLLLGLAVGVLIGLPRAIASWRQVREIERETERVRARTDELIASRDPEAALRVWDEAERRGNERGAL